MQAARRKTGLGCFRPSSATTVFSASGNYGASSHAVLGRNALLTSQATESFYATFGRRNLASLRFSPVVVSSSMFRGRSTTPHSRSVSHKVKKKKKERVVEDEEGGEEGDLAVVMANWPKDEDLEMDYEGEVDEENRPHGKGVATFSHIPLRYEGDFVHGEFHGKGVLVLTGEGGFRYEGDFVEDYFHGDGLITYNDGSMYQGQFKKGVYDGTGSLKNSAGGTHDGFFKRGVPHGPGSFLDPETKTLHEGFWYHFPKGHPLIAEKRARLHRLRRKQVNERMFHVMDYAAKTTPEFAEFLVDMISPNRELKEMRETIEEFEAELETVVDSEERQRKEEMLNEIKNNYIAAIAELRQVKLERDLARVDRGEELFEDIAEKEKEKEGEEEEEKPKDGVKDAEVLGEEEKKPKKKKKKNKLPLLERVAIFLEVWKREKMRAEDFAAQYAKTNEWTEEQEEDMELVHDAPDAIEEMWGDAKGLMCGYGVIRFKDFSTYEGYWEHLLPTGEGLAEHADGSMYNGEWLDGKMDGYGRITYNDNDHFEGEFVSGLRHGQGMLLEGDNSVEGIWVRDQYTTEEDLEDARKQYFDDQVPSIKELDTNLAVESSAMPIGMNKKKWDKIMDQWEEEEFGDEDKEDEEDEEKAFEDDDKMRRLIEHSQERSQRAKMLKKRQSSKGPIDTFNPKRELLKHKKRISKGQPDEEEDN